MTNVGSSSVAELPTLFIFVRLNFTAAYFSNGCSDKFNLISNKQSGMKLLITSMVILSAASVAVCQVIRNFRRNNLYDKRSMLSFTLMLTEAVVVVSDVLVSENGVSMYRLAMELLPSVAAMWLMSSFMSDGKLASAGIGFALCANVLMTAFNICRMEGIAPALSDRQYLSAASLMAVAMVMVFIYGLLDWLRCVKAIMKCGTVWAVVCLTVDVVYVYIMVACMAMIQLGWEEAGVMLLGGIVPGIGLRIMTDSKFLIWQKQETIIVESMKITSVPSASDSSNIEDVYKELYGRIVEYFETKKPFLDSELTINMIVKDVYSNKLYISRAISQFTGRNFCQFVNYYRVMHSMEYFRDNPEVRIHELATMSGFNSVVSYNMAFRLFMGENPSEWCRRERSRLIKRK